MNLNLNRTVSDKLNIKEIKFDELIENHIRVCKSCNYRELPELEKNTLNKVIKILIFRNLIRSCIDNEGPEGFYSKFEPSESSIKIISPLKKKFIESMDDLFKDLISLPNKNRENIFNIAFEIVPLN